MACRHCGMNAKRRGTIMSLDTFRAVVHYAEQNDELIFIGGGEPTIHPQFWDIMGIAMVADLDSEINTIQLVTNGKETATALRLARLAKQGKITCDLSQDQWHEPIDPEVVKAFTRPPRGYGYNGERDTDYRGIRSVSRILPQGRALANGIATEKDGCICDELFVTTDGHLHPLRLQGRLKGRLWVC